MTASLEEPERVNVDWQSIQDPWDRWRLTYEAIDRALTDSIARVGHAFKETDQRFAAAAPTARKLGELGWTIPMWVDVREIGDLLPTLVKGGADAWFEKEYFKNRSRELHSTCSELLSSAKLTKWRPLIEESVAAIRKRWYFVSLSALLPVCEAAMLAEAEIKAGDVKAATTKRHARATVGFEKLLWASLDGFAATAFRSLPKGASTEQVNRHLILHGRALPSNARIDCLKVLNAIRNVC